MRQRLFPVVSFSAHLSGAYSRQLLRHAEEVYETNISAY